MADNFFDQFDAAPANAVPPAAPPGNFFDQFDAATPPQTPINQALAAREQEVSAFQAEQQKRYEQQQAYDTSRHQHRSVHALFGHCS